MLLDVMLLDVMARPASPTPSTPNHGLHNRSSPAASGQVSVMIRPPIYTARELESPLQVDYNTALRVLRDGDVAMEVGLMRWGSNYTFLVTLCLDEVQFLGVYKPRIGERPLWDFPDGTLCQRETAAYVVAEALNWPIVPPTILREGPRGIGSVQIFIDHDPEQHYFTFDAQHQEQMARFAVFDAIINNADRKGGHLLLDADDHVWGIDHGLAFNNQHKLRTVIWDFAGQDIASGLLADVQSLCDRLTSDDALAAQLCALLSNHEILALRTRVQRLVDEGKYPAPGPGPNRPWPSI